MGGLVLVALAMILPYFFGQGSSDNLPQQIITPEEIKEYEPPFEHESFFLQGRWYPYQNF